MPFLDGPKPRVIAHRGLSLEFPENTLGAFRAAVEAGADILETDIHVSKDGEAVIAHDPDLARLTGRTGRIADYTANQLSQMDLGAGQGFLRLADALEALPGQKFNIDLKEFDVVEACVDVVTGLRAQERVLLASFDEKTRRTAAQKLPGVVTSATPSHVLEGKARSWLGLPSQSWSLPPGMVALQVPATRFGMALVTPSFVSMAHRKGLEVHVWTINDAATMSRFWDMGVDGIVTDRADIAHEARESRTPSP